MPGLNLVTEYKLDFPRVFLLDEGKDVVVDGVEYLFGVLRKTPDC
jgi:hypothetical protein